MEQYKKSNWSNEELIYLKDNYNNYTYTELSKILNRSSSAIQHKVSLLGLSKTQYSNKKKDAFKREDKNCLSCGKSQNRSKIFNKPKQKKANTIIMKYITESKQMNTYKKINCNRNKTQHYFSPELSYSNNIKKKHKK